MTVFKTFWKIVKKYKFVIILYTVMLVVFAGFNMQSSDNSVNFVAEKPDLLIINKDETTGLTKNLVDYLQTNCNSIEIENNEEAINDALFYREVNYIIYLPENYRQDFLDKKNPEIKIKSTGDYQSSLAEMMLSRYVKVANTYLSHTQNENELISKINDTISKETKIEITSALDTNNLARATFYYNFLNYSLLAGCLYVICLILSSFREEKIRKRTIISSTPTRKYNRTLLISNSILATLLWVFYVLLSFALIGDTMFTPHGLLFILNSFIFAFSTLTFAFLIGNLISNKNAINGIVNVVALGSSFLCGAFVPAEWLPDFVLKIAHIFPSYWYIQSNEMVKTLEVINKETLQPILINMFVLLGFSFAFILVTNLISRKKRKIA